MVFGAILIFNAVDRGLHSTRAVFIGKESIGV